MGDCRIWSQRLESVPLVVGIDALAAAIGRGGGGEVADATLRRAPPFLPGGLLIFPAFVQTTNEKKLTVCVWLELDWNKY